MSYQLDAHRIAVDCFMRELDLRKADFPCDPQAQTNRPNTHTHAVLTNTTLHDTTGSLQTLFKCHDARLPGLVKVPEASWPAENATELAV